MSTRDLSVVVPARDAAATVQAAVLSVLERADGLLEVVVVDDASTDGTAALVRAIGDARVRLLAGRGIGPAAARNDGVRFGPRRPRRLRRLRRPLDRRLARPASARLGQGHDVVARGLARVLVEGRQVGEPAVITSMSTVLVPIAVARAHPFDESLLRGEDLEWFLRLADAGVEMVDVDVVVMDYLRRPGSLSDDQLHAGPARRRRRRGPPPAYGGRSK